METVLDFSQIIIADLTLSGDNALIIGMAAAGLSPELRKKAILYGMVIAAVLRHGKTFVPKGTYPLLPYDRVLFITTRSSAAALDSFLAR